MATMTDQKSTEQALQRRDVDAVTQLAGTIIKTPLQLAERVRAMQQVAHVLSPAVSVAAIPDHIAINPVVVVIDQTFNAETGRGNDVYFQRSIHKSRKNGSGDSATYEPLEVSLNANAIKRMLSASGVNIIRSVRTDDGSKQNYWAWESTGRIRDFDGSWRDLPPGNVEIDLRDGSAQIGEWSAEAWARNEAAVEKKKAALPENQRWKAKPDLIGGWSGDRVLAARRFGLRLAEAKSLNALGRNLGLKQIYGLDELKKPFVIFRATWNPDMSDPDTRRMVAAAELGASHLLYPPASAPAALPAAGPREPAPVIIDAEPGQKPHGTAPAAAAEIESLPADDPVTRYTITRVAKQTADGQPTRFFIATEQTRDALIEAPEPIAMAAAEAKKAGRQVELDLERTNQEIRVLELREVPPVAAATELPADARFVADVREKAGKTNGRDWVKFTVVFRDGTEASTFSGSIAKDARDAKAGNLPVHATLTTSEKYPDQQNVEELSIIDTRQGTLPMTTEL
jgi:hypothetical protein